MIQEEEDRLLCEVNDMYHPKRKEFDATNDNLEFKLGSTESIHSYISHLLTYGGPVDVMSAKKEVDQRISSMEAKTIDVTQMRDIEILFRPHTADINLGCVLDTAKKMNNIASTETLNLKSGVRHLEHGNERMAAKVGGMEAEVRSKTTVQDDSNKSIYDQVTCTFELHNIKLDEDEVRHIIKRFEDDDGLWCFKFEGGRVMIKGSLQMLFKIESQLLKLKSKKCDEATVNEEGGHPFPSDDVYYPYGPANSIKGKNRLGMHSNKIARPFDVKNKELSYDHSNSAKHSGKSNEYGDVQELDDLINWGQTGIGQFHKDQGNTKPDKKSKGPPIDSKSHGDEGDNSLGSMNDVDHGAVKDNDEVHNVIKEKVMVPTKTDANEEYTSIAEDKNVGTQAKKKKVPTATLR